MKTYSTFILAHLCLFPLAVFATSDSIKASYLDKPTENLINSINTYTKGIHKF